MCSPQAGRQAGRQAGTHAGTHASTQKPATPNHFHACDDTQPHAEQSADTHAQPNKPIFDDSTRCAVMILRVPRTPQHTADRTWGILCPQTPTRHTHKRTRTRMLCADRRDTPEFHSSE